MEVIFFEVRELLFFVEDMRLCNLELVFFGDGNFFILEKVVFVINDFENFVIFVNDNEVVSVD